MTKRYAFTCYLDPDTKEDMDLYCYLKSKNRIRLINEAIKEYLTTRLGEELQERGYIKQQKEEKGEAGKERFTERIQVQGINKSNKEKG